jgi:pyruvate,water dikinase
VVGVQTPLSWTLWDVGGEMGFRLGYHELGLLPRAALEIPESVDDQFTAIFYGQGACNIDTFVKALAAMPGASGAEEGFFTSRSGEGTRFGVRWRPYAVRAWFPMVAIALPTRLARLRASSRAFWREATVPGRLDSLGAAQAVFEEALRRFGPAVGMQIVASTFAGMLYGWMQQLLTDIGRPDLELKLIGGYGSMQEVQLTQDLWKVAHGFGDLDGFLAEHGFHGPAEGELSSPSWREDRAPIAAMLAKFATIDAGDAPEVAEAGQAREREAAEREVLAHTTGRQRARARALLAWSRRYIPLRVEAKAAFMQVFDVARAAARAAGVHLVAAGTIDAPDDVFFLTVDELLDPIPTDARARVAERRITRDSYLHVELPLEWQGMPEPITADASLAPDVDDDDPVIHALGVSGGKVDGTARVLVDPYDPDALEPGDVLVCHTTDPSWSSHFFVASAVVIDVGGMLSHGAIVARELGIPCVINTRHGTATIRSGDRVLVDGDAGTVEIVARASP